MGIAVLKYQLNSILQRCSIVNSSGYSFQLFISIVWNSCILFYLIALSSRKNFRRKLHGGGRCQGTAECFSQKKTLEIEDINGNLPREKQTGGLCFFISFLKL